MSVDFNEMPAKLISGNENIEERNVHFYSRSSRPSQSVSRSLNLSNQISTQDSKQFFSNLTCSNDKISQQQHAHYEPSHISAPSGQIPETSMTSPLDALAIACAAEHDINLVNNGNNMKTEKTHNFATSVTAAPTRVVSIGQDNLNILPSAISSSPTIHITSSSGTCNESSMPSPPSHQAVPSAHLANEKVAPNPCNTEDDDPKPISANSNKISVNDVLCGRGGLTNHHPGNVFFRRMVRHRQEAYLRASKRDKASVARDIVDTIRHLNPPGRFLKKDPKSQGTWLEIGNRKAREKTSQALREGAPELREELQQVQQQNLNQMHDLHHHLHPAKVQEYSQSQSHNLIQRQSQDQSHAFKKTFFMHKNHCAFTPEEQEILERNRHLQPASKSCARSVSDENIKSSSSSTLGVSAQPSLFTYPLSQKKNSTMTLVNSPGEFNPDNAASRKRQKLDHPNDNNKVLKTSSEDCSGAYATLAVGTQLVVPDNASYSSQVQMTAQHSKVVSPHFNPEVRTNEGELMRGPRLKMLKARVQHCVK